jgi:DNA polymerase-3 subunit delta'
MDQDWKIAGHKKQTELLNRSIETGKLAHAYIFAGPSFVGKRTLAFKFAQILLESKTKDIENYFHPDFLEVSGDEGIKIEQIRDLIYKLSLKPYQSKYRVAIIDNAENMTIEAQNSLLKILEEPKAYTIIILITSNSNKLLRTIASRAQKINFGLVDAVNYEHLIPDKISESARNLVLTVASGRPGLALGIASNEELVEKLVTTNEKYQTMRSSDLVEKLKLAYELADYETTDLKQVLDFWQIKFEQELTVKPEPKIAHNISSLINARKYLDQNVNSKLLLTNLMLNLTA